jgi:hypothetical protein
VEALVYSLAWFVTRVGVDGDLERRLGPRVVEALTDP